MLINFRVTPLEAEMLRGAALRSGRSVSQVIRQRIFGTGFEARLLALETRIQQLELEHRSDG